MLFFIVVVASSFSSCGLEHGLVDGECEIANIADERDHRSQVQLIFKLPTPQVSYNFSQHLSVDCSSCLTIIYLSQLIFGSIVLYLTLSNNC